MQLISYKVEQRLPRVKKTRIAPPEYHTITYAYSNEFPSDTEYRNIAELLVKHMSIVNESRTLIRKGETTTWEEFKKAHGQKRRK